LINRQKTAKKISKGTEKIAAKRRKNIVIRPERAVGEKSLCAEGVAAC
jgi:hypothetical protein